MIIRFVSKLSPEIKMTYIIDVPSNNTLKKNIGWLAIDEAQGS